jgi:hypothetical protein
MRDKEIQEGLGDMAHKVEKDHEVQMARADLYKLAKYAIKLHDMLKQVPEETGLEGWVASKITKAADYIGSVYHHLDYEEATGELGEAAVKEASCGCDANSCSHCGGKHTLDEVGQKCECCGNMIKEVTAEGKFKSAAHRKAVHAAKASGRKKIKHLRKESLQDRLAAKLESKKKTDERSLTKGEEGKKEKYVKGMKKAKGDFKKRYGKDAEAVMYATATKMAKE